MAGTTASDVPLRWVTEIGAPDKTAQDMVTGGRCEESDPDLEFLCEARADADARSATRSNGMARGGDRMKGVFTTLLGAFSALAAAFGSAWLKWDVTGDAPLHIHPYYTALLGLGFSILAAETVLVVRLARPRRTETSGARRDPR
jgi:hypothetical protein